MAALALLLATGMFVVVCGAGARPKPAAPFPQPGSSAPTPLPVDGVPNPPARPAEKSVEQLLDDLERAQAQKAGLKKKEQELTAAVRKRLAKQAERLNKLGVDPNAEPDRVGRIVIQGFAAKDEKKIRDVLGVFPGQIIDYPTLECARARLEKTGFRGAAVEVVPNGPDSHFKDIRVRSAAELDR